MRNINKKLALVSYLGFLCFFPMVFGKSEFVKFHAKQGLVLFFAEIICLLVGWVPIIGWFLILYVVIISLLGLQSVLDGKMWKMPFIYKLANRINL